jgi:hypothetical protein
MTFHLTKKNAWIWIIGVSTVLLAAIGLLVPPEHWGLSPWRWIILGLLLLGVAAATIIFFMQSRDDTERDIKEEQREKAQQAMMTQLAQLSARGDEKSTQTTQTTPTLTPGVNFHFDDYFRLAHVSQLTEQTAKDIKILASQQHPNDREDTLSKFIGIGFWGYVHEVTWPYIFRSQILALTELNARGGILPLSSIKAHFDKAVVDHPSTYAQYTFDQWMNFMLTHELFLKRPGDAIELTLRGRDFLKFMTHWGWNADMRSN